MTLHPRVYFSGFSLISLAAASGNIVSAVDAFQNNATIEEGMATAAAVLTTLIWIILFKVPDSKFCTFGSISLYCALAITYSVLYAERVPLKGTLMVLHWLYLSSAGLYHHKYQLHKKTTQQILPFK